MWNLPRVTNYGLGDLAWQLKVIDPPEYYATRGRLGFVCQRITKPAGGADWVPDVVLDMFNNYVYNKTILVK